MSCSRALVRLLMIGTVAVAGAALATSGPAWADHDNGNGKSQDDKKRDKGPSDRVFFLIGAAALDEDPENPANEVVRLQFNSATGFAGVARYFNSGGDVQVRDLDNQLEARHRFQAPDTCGVGTPRMSLAIDLNGDNQSDGNASIYVGPNPTGFTGCASDTWLYEDFTGGDMTIQGSGLGPHPSVGDPARGEEDGGPNEEQEVDATQLTGPGEIPPFPGSGYVATWSAFETAIHAAFPDHRVCRALYIEDSSGGPVVSGHADLISMGNATLNGWEDIAGRFTGSNQDVCKVRPPSNHHD